MASCARHTQGLNVEFTDLTYKGKDRLPLFSGRYSRLGDPWEAAPLALVLEIKH
ncbi:hypothetical protein J6590_040018 [Homalodisca vitripennis]|nr:hypothetical protein J6590_040018 [Homalodisca vitripennis]